MEDTAYRAIAIVGLGAILPDAPNVASFWENVKRGRYSVTDVTPDRWDPALYYDPDPAAPDKTYSKIGGWVREYEWNPLKWRIAVPPRVAEAMDEGQKWAVACAREALEDYGYPRRSLNPERTAVILGNAMAGEKHYLTSPLIVCPEYARELAESASFAALPAAVRRDITRELHQRIDRLWPEITEDTMPGELANCIAGRIANTLNCRGPNFVTDAACASAMAAITAAVEGLAENHFDAAITGGIDRNMGASSFVKFCKIGALSATGTRPYAEGADGFVMGEGAAVLLLKRLADAERDGDKIYAVLRGVDGASDGKGKGITAPNPIGQKLAIERAWQNAGLSPATATLMEGHGTSTRVGDVVEVAGMTEVLSGCHLAPGAVALGSVKSNIGHLKGAAGAAGLLKTVLALHDKVLPPDAPFERLNPDIDFARCPLYVNTELQPWSAVADGVRRAGVSAFGFGGTNFHTVLEEYIPHRLTGNGKRRVAVTDTPAAPSSSKAPLRGALVIGAATAAELAERLRAQKAAREGSAPPAAPAESDLRAPERLAIDYGSPAELADKADKALKALAADQAAMWSALRSQGIFRGSGPAPKVAFLYTGQGSQYVNMLRALRAAEPIVAETFAEADRIMQPLLGRPLSEFIFVAGDDAGAVAKAEEDLKQTAITQPAVLAVDLSLTRLMAAYGIQPDMTMGHSLGEYGALVAAGALPFADALEAVSARGREMTRVSVADNGRMAAVFAPLEEIRRALKAINGYVVIANLNSNSEAVSGGASRAVGQAIELFQKAGCNVVELPVSHAFHTSIVEPASEPLRRMMERLRLESPRLPIVANVTGEFYPMGPNAVPQMLDLLARQIASPVQFVKGLETLYGAGARVFVEVGPKKALQGFAEDVLGVRGDVVALFTNHPKTGDLAAFNQALCGLYAAGLGRGDAGASREALARPVTLVSAATPVADTPAATPLSADRYTALGQLFAGVLERGWEIYRGGSGVSSGLPVVVTGAALGLPGTGRIFDDANVARILRGEQFIDVIPTRFRQAMLDKHITRLVKSDNGGPVFETILRPGDVIKLAGRGGALDLQKEFGVPAERVAALDRVTCLAIGAGLDALRDAGIPLVLRYKTTTKGTQLPDRWGLPDALRDDTGVIFASVFPGLDSFAEYLSGYYADRARREQLAQLEALQARAAEGNGHAVLGSEIGRRIGELRAAIEKEPYTFDRRFMFRVLSMGHSQFAEFIGARGPNTQINAACSSATQAVALAEDWIRAGRCRRVVIVSADDISSDRLMEWFGAGFLATGAAATDEVVEEAATPFDRRRHGMIIGMGAAAMVVESAESARERGLLPICEVLSAVTANSAFHGTRLEVEHISRLMEDLVARAEARGGVSRREMAPRTVFVSHETYTPARGGSASAEVHALRRAFGDAADKIVITNTKGFTGHAMGAGIEDVVAVKALETGCVPPVANFKEIDPELGPLNLSKGGFYPVEYALRLGAGFGSQISLTLCRWLTKNPAVRPSPNALGYANRIVDPAAWNAWLSRMAGYPAAELEVVQRTLRVRDQGAPAQAAIETVREAPATPARAAEAPAPAAAPPPVSVPGPAPQGDPVKERILVLLAEKTGYPPDLLDLDLDLEADLGVDTVKQADRFAAIREMYNIPRDPNLKLRDFPTLARVIRFVYDRRPDLAGGATPAPMEAVTPPAAPAAAVDDVQEKLLELVAEKTGYPKDMLYLDLDLEADLGIDTVKQADLFASLRAAYNIPRDPNLKLRDFPTLAHVIRFVQERRAVAAAPAEKTPPAPAAQPARAAAASFDAANLVPRRVPVPALRPPLAICKTTGVTLGPGRRVVIMPDRGGVADALAERLQAMGVEVLRADPTLDAGALAARLNQWLAGGPVTGVYWLPALDGEGNIFDQDLAAWREALRVRVKLLYTAMRTLYEQVARPDSFLMTATRLGGVHGYDEPGAAAPLGGAVTGFTKTYKRERMDALVKAVDFEAGREAPEVAAALIDESLRDPGVVEIGYKAGQRWTVGLEEQPAEDGQPGLTLDKGTVFLITGAAGSIVSGITADLAAASGGTFYLLDVTPQPAPDDPDLQRLATDKEGLKRDLHARLKARGERATPALVERELAALERAQAARGAIEAVQAAGGTARYFSVNLTDADAVAGVIREVRERSGRIDVLLHAAGMERSRFLPEKEPGEFDLVFDVKADGWFNLLHAIGDMPLEATAVFSSIAGRFGNAGQADYSAANDLLCKITSSFRTARPGTRALAIDWTAWAGIGMATRGSVPQMMERAGIEMLPPEAGIPWIRRELTAGAARGEIVVARSLGVLQNEWDATGGLDTAAADRGKGPMIGAVTAMSLYRGLRIETALDPNMQPFLRDHQIEGKPVLPGVMGVEAFAEAALWLLPEWHIEAIEDVNFLAPFKFYHHQPRTVTIEVLFHASGDAVVAHCRLSGTRSLPNQAEPQVTTHFTARVRLVRQQPELPSGPAMGPPAGSVVEASDIYRVFFHGPAYQVMERAWLEERSIIGQMARALPGHHHPPELRMATEPRLIELCFQTAALWGVARQGRMGLPERIQRISLWRAPDLNNGRLYAVAVPDADNGAFEADVLDEAGNRYVHLSGYRMVAHPDAVDLAPWKAAATAVA